MNLDYFIFYLEASVVCILIFLILLINDLKHSNREEKQIWYDRTIIAHILYFVSDVGWASIIGGVLPKTRFNVLAFNAINYVLLSMIAYLWFMFMASSEKMEFRTDRKKRGLVLIPMAVSFLAITAAYIADPEFWISRDCEMNPLYSLALEAAPVVYILCAFIFSVLNSRKAESSEEKRRYMMIGVYPLGVVFFGTLQIFALNAPLFCCGCTVMMLHFYIQNMQAMISIDPLTRLNNRGQIDRYMERIKYRENVRQYAVMLDINRFKQINDSYGHSEGDRALVLVAEALKETIGVMKMPSFLGRYGGDEFTLFMQAESEDQMTRLPDVIREKLAVRQKQNALLYELTVSLGYDYLQDSKDTMNACLARADEKLYQEKKRIGSLR